MLDGDFCNLSYASYKCANTNVHGRSSLCLVWLVPFASATTRTVAATFFKCPRSLLARVQMCHHTTIDGGQCEPARTGRLALWQRLQIDRYAGAAPAVKCAV